MIFRCSQIHNNKKKHKIFKIKINFDPKPEREISPTVTESMKS